METTLSVVITLAYDDATRRNYTFSGVAEEEIADVKDRILAINANMPANFRSTFVSEGGTQVKMIAAGKIITLEEEVIYNAG